MKVKVDRDRCASSGRCVWYASEVFDQGEDDGVVKLVQENPPEGLYLKVRDAAAHCPTGAISVEE